MTQPNQLPLFVLENDGVIESTKPNIAVANHLQDLGTFKDNMKAPIHGWFKYPAGYSYKFVYRIFEEMALGEGHWVYDPYLVNYRERLFSPQPPAPSPKEKGGSGTIYRAEH